VRAGLRMILEAQDDLQVIAEAADGAEAVTLTESLRPDVVLMDIRMPALDGIEATRRLSASGSAARVLVLTTYALDEYVYESLRAGAAGFFVKTESPERLVDAVRLIAAGEALLAPEITRRLIDHFLTSTGPPVVASPALDQLTTRELEVLHEVARGLANAEIAQKLFISEGTVKTHVARILFKLGLRDRVQAVVFAYEHGLIRPRGSAQAT
jgi:DNA-binding NarL/FixJ family response regulator